MPAGLAMKAVNFDSFLNKPALVKQFQGNVEKVSMGPQQTAIVTNDGMLWTCGVNKKGNLGTGKSGTLLIVPKMIQFFQQNNLKVADVSAGVDHMVACTTNGELYSWGNGGYQGFFKEFFSRSVGILGPGGTRNRILPTQVEVSIPGIQSIVAGHEFSGLLDKNSDVYLWGRGINGTLGDGHELDTSTPTLNEALHEVMAHDGIKCTKILSRGQSTLALFSDGSLYGWGNNDQAQLGVGHVVGIDIQHINHLLPKKVTALKGQKVRDFDLGSNTAICVTEDDKVYWWGLRLAWEPIPLALPGNPKIKQVAAGFDGYAVLTTENEIWSSGQFIKEESFNYNYRMGRTTKESFNGGEILSIGAGYRNKWAIVKN